MQLGLDKGAHGVAGILAWPGRYSRHLGRVMPIATEGRADGGTDYYMDPETATLFTAARDRPAARIARRPGSPDGNTSKNAVSSRATSSGRSSTRKCEASTPRPRTSRAHDRHTSRTSP